MLRKKAITLKQLRALEAIKQHGSVTLAAYALNLTVPAVSTQLKMLEENIGAQLYIRQKDANVAITLQGQEVLKAVAKIEASLTQCCKTIKSINDGKSGRISLGVVSTGKYFAPKIVALAKEKLPDIQFDLLIGNRQTVISALENNIIDLAITGRPPRYPVVDAIALAKHPHILIAPPDHPLLLEENLSAEHLLKETFIKREMGSGTRILMERYLDSIGNGQTYDWIEFNSNETIKQAVIAGLGIALISAHTVTDGLEANIITTINMKGLPIIRRWYVIKAKETQMTPVIENVQKFLVESQTDFIPKLPKNLLK